MKCLAGECDARIFIYGIAPYRASLLPGTRRIDLVFLRKEGNLKSFS
jgi:hypothetical protein